MEDELSSSKVFSRVELERKKEAIIGQNNIRINLVPLLVRKDRRSGFHDPVITNIKEVLLFEVAQAEYRAKLPSNCSLPVHTPVLGI